MVLMSGVTGHIESNWSGSREQTGGVPELCNPKA